jgi:hypothetical protein
VAVASSGVGELVGGLRTAPWSAAGRYAGRGGGVDVGVRVGVLVGVGVIVGVDVAGGRGVGVS